MVWTALGRETNWGRLENAAEYTVIRDPAASRCSITFRVNASSDRDPPDAVGLSHFVALALKRGSGNYPGLNNFEDYLKSIRSNLDIWSYRCYVEFACVVEFENLNETLNRLSDAMAVPIADDEAIELIEHDLASSIRKRLNQSLGAQVSKVHRSLQGLPPPDYADIVSRPDIMRRARDFIARYYVPSEMHLVLTINNAVSDRSILNSVKRNFKDVFYQSRNVSSAPMRTIRPSGGVYVWYHKLQNKLRRYPDKLAGARSFNASYKSPRAVCFDEACEVIPADQGENRNPGDWGTGRRLGKDDGSVDIVTLVPSLVESKDQSLVLTYRLDPGCLSSPSSTIWQYLVGHENSGSLRYTLRKEGLVDAVDVDTLNCGIGGVYFVISIELTSLGFRRSELVLRKTLDYLSNLRQTLLVTDDLYRQSLAWREVEVYDRMTHGRVTSYRAWADIVDYIKAAEAVFDGSTWVEQHDLNDNDALYLGEHLCPDNCVAILASSTFHYIPSGDHKALSVRYKTTPVYVKCLQDLENCSTGCLEFAMPAPTFALTSTSDANARRTGFVTVSTSTLSAQKWHPWKHVAGKFILPIVGSSPSSSSLPGLVLAAYLNTRLWPIIGKRLRGLVSYADGGLTLSLTSSPDDLKSFIRLLFEITADRVMAVAQSAFDESVDQIRSLMLIEEVAPNFELGFEEASGMRNIEAELEELNDLTLGDLPYITSGYFAMLLVGNVRHAHTLEISHLVGRLMGNDSGATYYRAVPNLDLPARSYNIPAHRALTVKSSDACGIFRAFDLGPCTPGSLVVAEALASHANSVLEQDLKVGHMFTSHAKMKAMAKGGHVWLIAEVIGLREIRYVEPKLNRSLFVNMKKAFDELNEIDMTVARNKVRKRFFDRRECVHDELDRLWEPIVSEGVVYDGSMSNMVTLLQGHTMAALFRRCVLTRETRKCVRISYTNKSVEQSRPFEDGEVEPVYRIRLHPDSDEEESTENFRVHYGVISQGSTLVQPDGIDEDSDDVGTPDSFSESA